MVPKSAPPSGTGGVTDARLRVNVDETDPPTVSEIGLEVPEIAPALAVAVMVTVPLTPAGM